MSGFVHLRVHSEYSLIDSVIRIPDLLAMAAERGMPAIAVTDQGNVSALVKFYRAALERGVKPVIGADVWVAATLAEREPTRLTLLCMNGVGFRQLSQLLTRSHGAGQTPQGRNVVLTEWLSRESLAGLVGLSGGQLGDLGRALLGPEPERGEEVLEQWCTLMPNRFYIELSRIGRPGEEEYAERAVEIASSRAVPLVATNDVCFLRREDFDAHEARICIAQGRTLDEPGRARYYTEEQFLKSAPEMQALFGELPEALANSVEIAERCSLELELGRVFLPEFARGAKIPAAEQLTREAERRLVLRFTERALDAAQQAVYRERLKHELGVICQMGFEGYFLIVADFIDWAKRNGIPVGPGRGSGAGSLVAYALGITGLDPIEHELLFERFLNPERVSMPDFDIDFCIEGRDRVIDYVAERYGRDRVSQIVTFGTMAARAVVRDVGRVLGMPYGYVDRIAKLIPFEIGITLEKALADDEELRTLCEAEEEVRGLMDLALRLEGLARNAGTHAGGVVIAPEPLTEFTPLYSEPGGGSLTQLDKDDVEAIGLIKFDFLGLKTLTVIDKAVADINRRRQAAGEQPIDLDALPVGDPETYGLLRECRTTAVFQLESRGMRDLVKRLRPDCFGDLVAILALFRPGPLQSGMVEEFINRKHGKNSAPIDYLHPLLEPILKPTYGVILYQEQVMQIAQVLAGYSLGGADLLRRAMGKKKAEEMAEQRSVFVAGALARGIEEARASHIFDLMEKFAGYGFNKSHSAAYALIAYQTAWLKAHYPESFMAAAMSADMDNTDKLVVLKDDCTQMGMTLAPPHVNRSAYEFTVGGERRINYGLGAVKGVGRSVVEAVVTEREARGAYRSLLELCERVGQQKLGRRALEALVKAGALDDLGEGRARLTAHIPDALRLAERTAHAEAAGQAALFGDIGVPVELAVASAPLHEWTERERLAGEREALGLYLTGHPFDQYAGHCAYFTRGTIAKISSAVPNEGNYFAQRREVTVAGLVMDVRRRGNRVSLLLDDNTERIEVTLFDEVFAASRNLAVKDAVVVVDGQLRFDEFLNGWRVTARRLRSADEAIVEHARRITIRWNCNGAGNGAAREFVTKLKEALRPFKPGRCEVCVQYAGPEARAMLTLGEEWAVRPTRELRERLGHLLGDERYSIHYPRHLL
jgi:DNA polymerase III subunit alpha